MTVLQVTPRPDAGDAGGRIRAAIERRAAAFEKAVRAVREGAGGDEAIHDVRVAARRLIATLSLWRDALGRRARRRAARRLRRLRRALGPLRNAEVHRERLRRHGRDALALGGLVARLGRRIERGRRRAARLAGGRGVARALERVRRGIADPVRRAGEAAAGAEARLPVAAARARAALGEALASGDDPAFHRARVAVKKWRYAIEAGGDGGLETRGMPPLRHLRAAQEALGTVQDVATLRSRLARHARRLRGRGLEAGPEAFRTLLAELDAERGAAIESLRAIAPALDRPAA